MRRKLEDVSLKLDILYDKLRKQVLSPATLQGLHTILSHVWQYDYQSCMQVDIFKQFQGCNLAVNHVASLLLTVHLKLLVSGHIWSDCRGILR